MTEHKSTNWGHRLRIAGIFLIVTVASLAGGRWLSEQFWPTVTPVPENLTGTVFPQSRPLPDIALTDHNGVPFGKAQLENHWTFMFFGFTHCPDVCPTTLQVLQRTYKTIQTTDDPPAQVVFVSVDPNRDTAPILKEYVQYFDPAFIGVTAPLATLTPLTRSLGILFAYDSQGRNDGSYTVDHSAQILLIDPAGRWRAVFSPPHNPTQIAETFGQIRQYVGG